LEKNTDESKKRSLSHEQDHFDITQIHALKMNSKLKEFEGNIYDCRHHGGAVSYKTYFTKNDITLTLKINDIGFVFEEIDKDRHQAQKDYDKVVNSDKITGKKHDYGAQKKLHSEIQQLLAELS